MSRLVAWMRPGALGLALAALLVSSSVFLYGSRRTLGDDVLVELAALVLVVFAAQRVTPRPLSLRDEEPRGDWPGRAASGTRTLLLGGAAFFFFYEVWVSVRRFL